MKYIKYGLYLGVGLLSANLFAKDVYISELVQKQPYKQVWSTQIGKLAANKKENQAWLRGPVSGPTSPVELVKVNGQSYYKASVCQTHNCAGNVIYVLMNQKIASAIRYEIDEKSGKEKTFYYGNLKNKANFDYIKSWRDSEKN